MQKALPQASLAGIPLNETTLPELLREQAGAACVAVGKWHVGYSSWRQTPTGRGFDHHVGFFQGESDYYTKRFCSSTCVLNSSGTGACGLDFWRDREPSTAGADVGMYSTALYRDAAVAAIDAHVASGNASSGVPLLLYIAWQSAHVPLQAPPPNAAAAAACAGVADPRRAVYCAMVQALDAAIGDIHAALRSRGLWDRSLVLGLSDNGGMPPFVGPSGLFCASAGSNYPLRAGKATLFEGGVRAVAVLGGGAVAPPAAGGAAPNRTYSGLMHAVDVAPTLLEALGVPRQGGGGGWWRGGMRAMGDGVSHWRWLARHVAGAPLPPPPRSVVPLNIAANGTKDSAIIVGDLKLILRPSLRYDGYYPPPPRAHEPAPRRPHGHASFLLFNLTADAEEKHDLSAEPAFAPRAQAMLARLAAYAGSGDYSDGQDYKAHVLARPVLHGGVWAPWS